jgi:hypothetical protein
MILGDVSRSARAQGADRELVLGCTLSTRIFTDGCSSRRFCNVSMNDMPGIDTSSSTTSAIVRESVSIKSYRLAASPVTIMSGSCSTMCRSPARTTG